MVRRDKQRVRRYLEECAAAEAQQLAETAGFNSDGPGTGADKAAGHSELLSSAASDDVGKGGVGKHSDKEAAVLPWWLPPEDIPAQYSGACPLAEAGYWMPAAPCPAQLPCRRCNSSRRGPRSRLPTHQSMTHTLTPAACLPRDAAELSCGGVVHGKTTVATRKRLMGVGAAGQAVWTSSEHYAVLLTTAGPPPSG